MAQPQRKVRVEQRYGRESINERFIRERYDEAGISGGANTARRVRVEREPQAANDNFQVAANDNQPVQRVDYRQQQRPKAPPTKTRQQKEEKKASVAAEAVGERADFMISKGLFALHAFLWPVQLLFGIAHLFGVGLLAIKLLLVGNEAELTRKSEEGLPTIVEGFKWLGKFIAGTLNDVIEKVTGIDLGAIIEAIVNFPETLYMTTLVMILAMGLFMMFTTGLIFMMRGVDPFAGKNAAAKAAFLILCIFGYIVPIANMISWSYVWYLSIKATVKNQK